MELSTDHLNLFINSNSILLQSLSDEIRVLGIELSFEL